MPEDVGVFPPEHDIAEAVTSLRDVMRKNGYGFGAVFFATKTSDFGFLFPAGISLEDRLQILSDMQEVITKTREYFVRTESQ